MVASSTDRVDGRSTDISDTNVGARDHNEDTQIEDNAGLSKTKTSSNIDILSNTNDTTCSSIQPFTDSASKTVKEEPQGSPSGVAPGDDREDGHQVSISSSARYSSKLPTCLSPSRTAEPSRTHGLFSPQPTSTKVSRP